MEFPSQAVIAVLTYLLPGFIAAWVFFGLTPAPWPIPFERLVQALIFTLFVPVLRRRSGLEYAGALGRVKASLADSPLARP